MARFARCTGSIVSTLAAVLAGTSMAARAHPASAGAGSIEETGAAPWSAAPDDADRPDGSTDESAQPPDPAAPSMIGRTFFRTGVGGSHFFRTRMDRGGSLSRSEIGAGISARHILTSRVALSAVVGYELEQYRFRNAVGFDGRGWQDIHHVSMTAGVQVQVTEEWAIFGSSSLRFGAEDGASWDDAMNGGGTVGAVMRVNETLRAGAGFTVQSRIERSTIIIPIVVLDWEFADQWRLVTKSGDLFFQPGLEVSYTPEGEWSFGASASYLSREFRLSERGDVPDGVGNFTGIPVLLHARWKPTPRFDLTMRAGVLTAGTAELRDERGRRIGKDNLSAGVLLSAMFEFRF